jgi:hypothetical protein
MKLIVFFLLFVSSIGNAQDIYYKSVSQYTYINKEGDFIKLPNGGYPKSEFINGKALIHLLESDFSFAYINTAGEILQTFLHSDNPLPPYTAFTVKSDEKYGIKDSEGKWIIEPNWDSLTGLYKGYAVAKSNNQTYIINNEDEIILNINEIIDYPITNIFTLGPSEGIIRVLDIVQKNEQYNQYFKLDGQAITQRIPGEGGDFYSGFAMIQEEPYGSCYFINTRGQKEPKIPDADYYWHFNSGLAPQLINGLWGYINTEGETVIANQYQFVTPFRGDYAAVSLNEPRARKSFYFEYPNLVNDGWGTYQIIDKTGKPINEFYYLGVPKFLNGSVAKVRILAEDGESERTALIDLDDGGRIFDIDEPFELMYDYPIDETTTRYSP